ncbi:MAG: VWA domain-containing protein [Alphaproteobacteria bacterium]|nr:VWA domain-containing protein [Alphaproteobacteria bacterium]
MKRTLITLSAFSALGLAAVACSIIEQSGETLTEATPVAPKEERLRKEARSDSAPSPAPTVAMEREADVLAVLPKSYVQPPLSTLQLADVARSRAGHASGAVALDQIQPHPPGWPHAPVLPHPPHHREDRERYDDVDPNPVKLVSAEPVSTFSIDVDTASYANVRRFLKDGQLPPLDAVRVEELINYFDYKYAPSADADQPFAADVALFTSPWDAGSQLLRIGIKGFEIEAAERPPANLVFLIDTSGSMDSPDKLPLLQRSLRLLVDQMRPDDCIAIVAYAGSAGVVLEPTAGADKAEIIRAIENFRAGGSTAGAEGITKAYQLAEASFDDEKINRVILATDGDFNVGVSDPDRLEDFIAKKRESGVYLSILGFGRGNLNDLLMQKLAQAGNGNASYIDSLMEARKVLVDEMGSTLFPIADDVKIQIEFNPEMVAEYRLIGYETRMLAREDFNNDQVDAGEIGSGHTVTALYEITPPDSPSRLVDDLRYSVRKAMASEPSGDATEVAWLRLRYKRPGEDVSALIERPVLADAATSLETAPADARFAAAVAGFGQILRQSPHVEDFDLDAALALARSARGDDPFGYRAEFIQLIGLAKSAKALDPING